MRKAVGLLLLTLGTAAALLATPVPSPEIDAGSAMSALALISGAALVIRGRRK
jgi:hypothetical protein